ncbi:hypothetical protein [Mastigocladopsis repens]|uniref:hypothetical protein n=1 Tax=Mastigocladopsis repens TaxID=221287 RepID=UPI00036CF0D4|nr:hypothetical protein [Mastigocladopsis repens]
MAGNEIEVCRFLFSNIENIDLKHIGQVREIGAPLLNEHGYLPVQTLDDLLKISTEDARKKADVYLNGVGVSIKQLGGSFAYNRLQRANIIEVYSILGFSSPESKLNQIDEEVYKFHQGLLTSRNRPWEDLFSEQDFKDLLNFLMMRGSPNLGMSNHPAAFILEAPATDLSCSNIQVYSFSEYFDIHKQKLKIAIRRQWVGQDSNSEHSRALSLTKKISNAPWVFNDIAGQPKLSARGRRWREDFPEAEKKTVYFLMIEKLK